jgi:penicillin-binding protein 2
MVLTEDVELAQLARIEARREQFPSVEVREGLRRSYPDGPAVAHLLGYVGEASEDDLARTDAVLRLGDIVGKTGLERGYDDTLRGDRGWNLVTVNNLGRRMSEAWVGRPPEHGRDIRLTIDLELQRTLIDALGAESGAGAFLDPWTGEVLALGSTPAFDPNRFADGLSADEWRRLAEDPARPLLARAIASRYAPGSTFKVIMAVAGLERRAVAPGRTVFCGGSTVIYGDRRLCWKRGGHGHVDIGSALVHSCNVFFYQLGKELGIDPIHHYGAMFGLGEETGIDLPGESPGILPSRDWKQERYREDWYPGDTISVAIGQGLLAVTPLQAARMIAGADAPAIQLDVRPETFRTVRQALRGAVEQGTGTRADLGPVSVAGKTGTAQVYKHSAGIDSDRLPKNERDHAWFVGYAPADQPRIAFAVVVEHGGHGGAAAAPIARAVLEAYFAAELREQNERRAGAGEGGSHVRASAAR